MDIVHERIDDFNETDKAVLQMIQGNIPLSAPPPPKSQNHTAVMSNSYNLVAPSEYTNVHGDSESTTSTSIQTRVLSDDYFNLSSETIQMPDKSHSELQTLEERITLLEQKVSHFEQIINDHINESK